MKIIREFETRDESGLIKCIIELQEFERVIEPNRSAGKAVSEKYFEHILDQVKNNHGKIFVAEISREIAGFISVWIAHRPDEIMTTLTDFAYISDLIVLEQYRGQSLGTELLENVKNYAKNHGVKIIKVQALTKNTNAINIYKKIGFEDYEVVLLNYLK